MTRQTKCPANRIKNFIVISFALLFTAAFASCKTESEDLLTVWTCSSEIVSYVELYNATHKDSKAVVVYKEAPAQSLPPAKDEITPDIIIGPWLKNSSTRKYFKSLDYLFIENNIEKRTFYLQLLDYGKMNDRQYLLPVSFNLPALIFSKKNEGMIEGDHILNINQIKTISQEFNKKNKNDVYTSMGFAPCWYPEFLYLVTKLYGTDYREKGTSFTWNEAALQQAIVSLKEWTLARNSDTASEQNFQFKYLYMPPYRQIMSDRCLFAYTTSDKLFNLSDSQLSALSFRWIEHNGNIPVEDDIVTLGVYKKAKHPRQADKFIEWFMKESTQKTLIERKGNMKLDTDFFGIAGGFSSLKNVNETVYPNFYRHLMSNIPSAEYITTSYILPYRWPSLKQRVILPYLLDSTNTGIEKAATLQERITDWSKQYF